MYFLSVPKDNSMDNNKKLDIEAEIERLINSYGNDVLRTSYMYLKDMQKAEDAFQEVFYKVYKKFGSFRGESSEKTWIIRITINVCKDMLRSAWIKRVLLSDKVAVENDDVTDVESKIIRKDENMRLFEEVTSLPPSYKEVIILFYYHECDTAEISKILKIAQGTVRSRLHRGREILKSKLGGGLVQDG